MRHRGENPGRRSQFLFTEPSSIPGWRWESSLLILWLLARMALLSWADLSYVLPVTSLGYVGNALMGRFFLNEQITPERWMGTLLIVGGVALVGLSQPTPEKQT